MKFGALGMKIMCSGRLGGAEMSRTEWYREAACRCTRCAPISSTATRWRGRRTGDRRQGVDFQGEIVDARSFI